MLWFSSSSIDINQLWLTFKVVYRCFLKVYLLYSFLSIIQFVLFAVKYLSKPRAEMEPPKVLIRFCWLDQQPISSPWSVYKDILCIMLCFHSAAKFIGWTWRAMLLFYEFNNLYFVYTHFCISIMYIFNFDIKYINCLQPLNWSFSVYQL